MANRVFGIDFSDETSPTGSFTVSVHNGTGLVDVALSNLHKALTAATTSQAGAIELATDTEVLTGTDTARAVVPSSLRAFIQKYIRVGTVLNGKISVTVASNNLTLALKTLAGSDPSSSDPVIANIGGTVVVITSALSVTANAATNWCNAGSTELATNAVDYFAYLGYNATDGVTIGFSRYPAAERYGDFSTTSTNEKYCRISTITTAATNDPYMVIGRFEATLSAGAGYTWTVPTYTPVNLVQAPIFETRWLSWSPAYSANGSMTYTTVTTNTAKYIITRRTIQLWVRASGTTGGTASNVIQATAPFDAAQIANFPGGFGQATDSSPLAARVSMSSGTPNVIQVAKYDNSNWALAASKVMNVQVIYEI